MGGSTRTSGPNRAIADQVVESTEDRAWELVDQMAEEAREERWADFRRALRRHWQKDFGTGRRFDVFREMELEPVADVRDVAGEVRY